MNKVEALETASNLITGDRAEAYGSFEEQMVAIATAFNAIKHISGTNKALAPEDVSLLLMLLKLHRRETAGDLDSSIDLIGYAALDLEAFADDTRKIVDGREIMDDLVPDGAAQRISSDHPYVAGVRT